MDRRLTDLPHRMRQWRPLALMLAGIAALYAAVFVTLFVMAQSR